MEKVKVLFRKVKVGQANDVVAFFPELPAKYGCIMCYSHIGQHSEASLDYYNQTKKASETEYAGLLQELRRIYDDVELVVRQKLNYTDVMCKAWNSARR